MNWIKSFFSQKKPVEEPIDLSKLSSKQLVSLLDNKTWSIGDGNKIVLQILKNLVNYEVD